jgi:Fe-S-cluster-containing hydrogenase component 2
MKITMDISLCYACKTCQLICSYHHTKVFWPEKSSIKVSRNPQNGIINWCIDSTCDGCENEDEPLCVKYCVYEAIRSVKRKKSEEVKIHD